jgi:uncharacterized protein YegP (UPF0339 family)
MGVWSKIKESVGVAPPCEPDAEAATFIVYEAADGFRWRLSTANNRIVADSGEAYTRERDCTRAIKTVARVAGGAVTVRAA